MAAVGFRNTIRWAELHPSALKPGVTVEDIEHAVRNAMVIDLVGDNLQLCLGPNRRG